MIYKYWIHSDGTVDKGGAFDTHLGMFTQNRERFGVPEGKTLTKDVYKKHFRVGYDTVTGKAYIETYKIDNKTFSILKRYMPSEIPRMVSIAWAQKINNDYLNITGDRFFKAKNLEQLLQKDMPEYHKTITQFRECLRDLFIGKDTMYKGEIR
jgi:hypothetical protein